MTHSNTCVFRGFTVTGHLHYLAPIEFCMETFLKKFEYAEFIIILAQKILNFYSRNICVLHTLKRKTRAMKIF